jgi:hypothetical protein
MRTAAKFILMGAIGLWIISLGIYLDTHVQAPPEDFFTVQEVGIEKADIPEALMPAATSTIPIQEIKKQSAQATIPKPSIQKEIPSRASMPVVEQSVLISGGEMREKEIDIRTIVLVRCLFQTQYFSQSSQPWNEQEFNVGSGVLISPKGYVITARHILEVRRELLGDPAGRKWQMQKCEIAETDKNQSEIASVGYWGEDGSLRFRPASIVYKPTDSEYREGAGLDFAVLKIESPNVFPFASLVPQVAEMEPRSRIIAIGYPGRESASPQKLERFDGEFTSLTYFEESPCDGTIKPCGLRYAFRRYPYNYEKDFWKSTELGIVTPYFRGGFSGGPAFFKGNLIGIVTHGRSGNDTESGWDEAFILTSFDILGNLRSVLEL